MVIDKVVFIFTIMTLQSSVFAISLNYRILELNELSTSLTTQINSKKPSRLSKKTREFFSNIEEKHKDISDLVAQSNDYIELAKDVSKYLENKLNQDEVLQGDDLSTIENLLRSLLIIAETNIQIISKHDPMTNIAFSIGLDDDRKVYNSLLSYSTNLNLFNIYNETFKLFLNNGPLRRLVIDIYNSQKINYPYLEKINEHIEIVNDDKFRSYLVNASLFYNLNKVRILKKNNPILKDATILIDSIQVQKSILTQIYVKYNFVQAPDVFIKIIEKSTNFISKLFGNLVGKIRWRHGHLYEHAWARKILKEELIPLDIISEKTPFAATDLFIPGHFGHIALYLGTREQLIEIGMWNDPLIIPYQEEIKKGNNILESIRPGSQLTNLDKFLEIDELTIIKQPNVLNQNEISKLIYKKAFEQLGKAYDFNFDVYTLSTVVCSEIIYHAFGHIKWPTVYRFGRNTITPDDVIELSYYDNSPVKFSNSYIGHKNRKINKQTMPYIGEKLGLTRKSARMSSQDYSYDRSKKVCKTIQTGSQSSNFERKYKRVCTKQAKQLVYEIK